MSSNVTIIGVFDSLILLSKHPAASDITKLLKLNGNGNMADGVIQFFKVGVKVGVERCVIITAVITIPGVLKLIHENRKLKNQNEDLKQQIKNLEKMNAELARPVNENDITLIDEYESPEHPDSNKCETTIEKTQEVH